MGRLSRIVSAVENGLARPGGRRAGRGIEDDGRGRGGADRRAGDREHCVRDEARGYAPIQSEVPHALTWSRADSIFRGIWFSFAAPRRDRFLRRFLRDAERFVHLRYTLLWYPL